MVELTSIANDDNFENVVAVFIILICNDLVAEVPDLWEVIVIYHY